MQERIEMVFDTGGASMNRLSIIIRQVRLAIVAGDLGICDRFRRRTMYCVVIFMSGLTKRYDVFAQQFFGR